MKNKKAMVRTMKWQEGRQKLADTSHQVHRVLNNAFARTWGVVLEQLESQWRVFRKGIIRSNKALKGATLIGTGNE